MRVAAWARDDDATAAVGTTKGCGPKRLAIFATIDKKAVCESRFGR